MRKLLNAGSLREMEHILNGGIRGGKQVVDGYGLVHGLHGKTLIFTNPTTLLALGTTTFSDPTGAGLTYKQVNEQIQDTGNPGPFPLAGILSKFIDRSLWIIQSTPTDGIVLEGTGTANPLFGFSDATITGTVYAAPDGSAPKLISDNAHGKPTADGYYILVETA